ncbi:MAG: glycosyltransferase family 4 protein [Acidobacteria bacterium]|nr:glycosyltransferase family 4 protein [Acidobacteriota bacterium]
MTKPRLHVHSDCQFFSGAENMVGNLVGSDALREQFDVSFSYRYTLEYERGFRSRVSTPVPTFPLRLRDTATLMELTGSLPKIVDRGWKLLLFLLQVRYFFLLWNTAILWRFFRRERVDILHVNNGGYPAAYSCNAAVLAARLAGIRRIVYVVNNIAQPYASPLRWTDYPIDRLVAGTVTVFVTGSGFAADALRRVLRLRVEQVRTIQNGIAPRRLHEDRGAVLERLGLAPDRTLLAVIAVIEQRKGHAVLIEAMRVMRGRLDPSEMPMLLIEGVGSKLAEVKALIRKHALDDCIHCLGSEEHVFDLMNTVDVIVLPSISHEDFPNVILEAMSLGKSVVASRIAGVPEQVTDMESGILIKPGDAGALAEALVRLVRNPGLRRTLGDNGLERFKAHFREDLAVSRYMALYEELCTGALHAVQNVA